MKQFLDFLTHSPKWCIGILLLEQKLLFCYTLRKNLLIDNFVYISAYYLGTSKYSSLLFINEICTDKGLALNTKQPFLFFYDVELTSHK